MEGELTKVTILHVYLSYPLLFIYLRKFNQLRELSLVVFIFGMNNGKIIKMKGRKSIERETPVNFFMEIPCEIFVSKKI